MSEKAWSPVGLRGVLRRRVTQVINKPRASPELGDGDKDMKRQVTIFKKGTSRG